MANVTDFNVRMLGEEETLNEIVHVLKPAVEEIDGFYGQFILHMDRPNLEFDPDNENHKWIGLNYRQSGWYEIRPPEPTLDPCEQIHTTDSVVDICDVIDWSRDFASRRRQHRESLSTPRELVFSGSCKWCPPFLFIEALSRRWPTVFIEFCGTTEHTHYEEWEAIGGVFTLKLMQEWVYWEYRELYHVVDGRAYDPPLSVPDYVDPDSVIDERDHHVGIQS